MRVRIDLPVGSQAKTYLLCSNARFLLVHRNPTSLFFDLRCNSMSRADGLPFIFFVMPLFLIVLGASGIGAAIALYILRKYDDPNTL